ncbi:MAG: MFS transporter [Dinoroseobacter sp.]|nr:MFS transporter [Dinoroseobacter sp.]
MLNVLGSSWALLLGLMLLMVGNGMQGTLLGIRGDIEGFSTLSLSIVMSAYFAGFLFGSRAAPEMIRRVGHVRVFAALGSLVSAALILFPVATDPISWTALRIVIGFCFSAVYVTSESWLNNSTTNETRGQALALYVIVQMVGIVLAQILLGFGDPSGYVLFIIPSVLVSLAFAPILLSVTPTPAFESTAPMSFRKIFEVSPLGCVGLFLLGGVFSAMFGMGAVYATQIGLTVREISVFIAMMYVGGVVLQYPIGWASDRMDRRRLIVLVAAGCVLSTLIGLTGIGDYTGLLVASFLIGGTANPLYALLLAYTNDYLDNDDMASASARLVFINGTGAIAGPLITGWLMSTIGPHGFFLFIGTLMGLLIFYGGYRMTQRPALSVEDTGLFTPILPSATTVAMEATQEAWIEADEQNDDENATEIA